MVINTYAGINTHAVQPVPETMRLEMVIRIQNEILDGQSSRLFSNEPFEKRPVMTIEDFVFHSDDRIESGKRNSRWSSQEWKTKSSMVITGMENEILDGHHRSLIQWLI